MIEKKEKIEKRKARKAESAEINELIKNTLIMLAIAVIAGGILGIVYEVTKAPIAEMEANTRKEALRSVFYLADSFSDSVLNDELITEEFSEKYSGVEITDCVKALDTDKNLLGYVIEVTTHEGYGGDIVFFMGVSIDGTINALSLTSISETVGLGMNAESVLLPQFENRNELEFEVTKTGANNDTLVDAISSATITSNAITKGVNAGLYFFRESLKGGADYES